MSGYPTRNRKVIRAGKKHGFGGTKQMYYARKHKQRRDRFEALGPKKGRPLF